MIEAERFVPEAPGNLFDVDTDYRTMRVVDPMR